VVSIMLPLPVAWFVRLVPALLWHVPSSPVTLHQLEVGLQAAPEARFKKDTLPMDGMLPVDTLFESLARKAETPRKQGKGRPGTSRQGSPGGSTGWREGYTALVGEDGLFVRVVAASNPGSHRPPACGTGAHLKAITEAFRPSFTDVWSLVSRHADRQRLLDYWNGPREPPLPSDRPVAPHPRPLIRVVDAGLSSPAPCVCSALGHQLDFPAALVLGQPHRLAGEIARALAQVVMRVYGIEMEQILRRWGVEGC
jgi:hypothetical protein